QSRKLRHDVRRYPRVRSFDHLGVEADHLVAQGLGLATEGVEGTRRVGDSAEDRAGEVMERLAGDDDRADGTAHPRGQGSLTSEQRSDGREVQLVGVAVELEHEVLLAGE